MKYRIKITTFKNGRNEFRAEVKKWYGWTGIMYEGSEFSAAAAENTREAALGRIDRHYEGNAKPLVIYFEYIEK